MNVTRNGDRVLIEMSVGESMAFAARMGEVLGMSKDEMDLIFEEVLA
jgi:hypothetical protein